MKTAIIGVGKMGLRHVQVAQELGLEVVSVCDANVGALATVAQERGLPRERLYTDARSLLFATKPDCVVVATTAPAHADCVCLAAELGARYILCEKPMAVSIEECDRMIETCRARGVRLAVNHQMRFMEQYTEPRKLVLSEALGGLTSVTILGGNFGLAMNGCHYFEMFRFLTDEQPVEVTAWLSADKVPNPRGEQFEDRAGAVRLVTASGKRFYLEAGSDQGHGMTVIYNGRNGQIIVNELTGVFTASFREEQHRLLPTTRYGMTAVEECRRIAPADAFSPSKAVLRALLSGDRPPSGEDGRLAVEVLVAAYVSHEKGNRTIRLDQEALPRQRRFPWA